MNTKALLMLMCSFGVPSWVQAEQRYVIVVGQNASLDPTQKTLQYADDDAAQFFELLRPGAVEAHLLTSLDAESQRLFPDLAAIAEPPTLKRLDRIIARLRTQFKQDAAAGRSSTVLFVYAGHGDVKDGEGYITLADGRFTRGDLRSRLLSGVRADRVHLIIDACKSYYLVAGRGAGGRREPYRRRFAAPEITEGVGYILSTSNDAESHEWSAIQGGVFSHEIRSAMLGGADLDGDGAVDYEELALFVAVANEGIEHPKYRPNVFIRPPANDVKATILSARGKSTLKFGANTSGRLSLTDPRGLRYVDTRKGAGAPLTIALLHTGRYSVEWAGAHYAVESKAGVLGVGDLQPEPEFVASRGDGNHAFEQLFSHALEPTVLRGYRLGQRTKQIEQVAPPTPAWVLPTLAAGAAIAAGAGVGLHLASLDAFDAADTGAQTGIVEQESRGTAFAYGAAGAYVIATGALSAAIWVYLSND